MTSGSFSGQKQGNTIKLTSNTQKINMEEDKDTYKLYMWIDAYQESNPNMAGKAFTVSIYGEVSYYDGTEQVVTSENEPNAPELAEGMIPIKYNYQIDEWQKADSTNTNNDWYNYNEQYWANAVMVTSESRDRYMNADVGTTILEDDILTYYVWIPRYRYVLFNVEGAQITEKEIQIEFQKTTDEVSNGTQNGEFLTHPAFWWDNNSDGERTSDEELSGIWFGKFELGGTTDKPLVKPNIVSLRSLNVLNLFNTIRNINSSMYLTEDGINQIDAHMIKNMDWGAVTYLTLSKYGKNNDVCGNNSSDYYTGRSGAAVGGSIKTAKLQYNSFVNSTNTYTDSGYYTYNDYYIDYLFNITTNKEAGYGTCASTTGNVSGIYDMAGGSLERTMGTMKSSNNVIAYSSSGFNANNMPNSKYYDLYDYGTSYTDYSRKLLGDATGEVRDWNPGTQQRFVYSNNSWFVRGGFTTESDKSIFYYGWGLHMNGSAETVVGTRSVLVLP